jgi:hypothetical protein
MRGVFHIALLELECDLRASETRALKRALASVSQPSSDRAETASEDGR